jgi:hypothetical protein
MFNSLVITVGGDTYTFECHSYDKALEILASHYNLWKTSYKIMPIVEKFELV